MTIFDLANGFVSQFSIVPGTSRGSDGDVNGSSVDMKDADGPVCAQVGIGDSGEGGSYSLAIKMEESDTGSGSWTTIDDVHAKVMKGSGTVSVASGVATLAASSQSVNDLVDVALVSGRRTKRYVRITTTLDVTAGSSSGTDIPQSGILISPKKTV